MAGRAADPAALLTVYLRYDRLADAADLALNHFAAYQKASHMLCHNPPCACSSIWDCDVQVCA